MGLLTVITCQNHATASDDWLPVRETDLSIQTGSPLDFSRFLRNRPIDGAGARLTVGDGGHLARQASPTGKEVFHCASLAWSPASGGFPDHATADVYARQLAMRGYNIARFHFLDASLMMGRRRDFDLDPETLDRVHYLMAALKRNGIYWMVDGLTSWRGGHGGFDDRWGPAPGLKLEMHYDDRAFEHWRQLVTEMLTRVNPYTGTAPIHDEALGLLILANEGGMEFETVVHEIPGRPHYPSSLKQPFNTWLQQQYRTTAELREAWGDLQPSERLEAGSIELPRDRYLDTPRMRDLQAYFIHSEQALLRRMTDILRGLGYKGLISSYNNWPTVQTALTRSELQAVAMNTYHDGVNGYEPGSSIKDDSAISGAAAYLRAAAAARWLGKPFAISEYDHVFWNRHRYEGGLVIPAYAALQGWDILCRHGHGPIALRYGEPFPHKRGMLPYAIALDPVARAGETLAALLFRRGDVSAATNTIPFAMRGLDDLDGDMQAREPDDLTSLALVSAIGLRRGNGLRAPHAVDQPRSSEKGRDMIAALKTAGLLSAANRTDLAKGIFESDTGQLELDTENSLLKIVTPRTEAIAFSSLPSPAALDILHVESAQGSGLLALSAIDQTPSLLDSKRMLLVYATDARSTRMRFRDPEEKVIEDFGTLPVRIRPGSVRLALAGRSGRWRISPVGLDGVVHPPLYRGSGPVRLDMSNETPHGPTTFFLLEIE
ncbi:glycoside hydrolase [Pseudorhizobium endolithicum]|uniref:Glycoside hydrolase n=2 Tax=Pseudorhizobium endolithicum TaxID=1191678 RepID=A0ABM8PNA9_9HYPH|nr:glycoside hydrolase [Pseudorhizobium endolithicum]